MATVLQLELWRGYLNCDIRIWQFEATYRTGELVQGSRALALAGDLASISRIHTAVQNHP